MLLPSSIQQAAHGYPALAAGILNAESDPRSGVFSDDVVDHEIESLLVMAPEWRTFDVGETFNHLKTRGKTVERGFLALSPNPVGFCTEMIQQPLRFVQRGRILLRCGSAFALSLPSLGVSSLDLGRLFTQAALFSCTVIPGSLVSLAPPE